VYCRRDGYTPTVCSNPFQLGTTTPLAVGTHTVDYYVDTGSGIANATPAASYTWQVVTSTTAAASTLSTTATPYDMQVSDTSNSQWYGTTTITDTKGRTVLQPTTDPKGSGKGVNLHRIYKDGTLLSGGWRSEATFRQEVNKLYPANDYWMAFAVMMSSTEPIVTNSSYDEMLVFQTHATPPKNDTYPDIALTLKSSTNQMRWKVSWNEYPSNTWVSQGGTNPDVEGSTVVATETMPAAGTWYRYIVHYRPGYLASQNPVLEIWRAKPGTDYTKIASYTGLNTYNSLNGPSYPRIGLYKWSTSSWNSSSIAFYETPLFFGQGANLYDSAKASLSGL
jgi:hypothetical protein